MKTALNLVKEMNPEPIYSDEFEPLALNEIKHIEVTFECNLSELHKALLNKYGSFMFNSEYCIMLDNKTLTIGTFFTEDLLEDKDCIEERLPRHYLPFNDDGFGNWFCISCAEQEYGTIFFSNHNIGTENDSDESKQSILIRVADSLSDFFDKLVEKP